jgi:D-alanyl-lipoteichoic acid acyltransferase DltB (MBOAT superfamily)
MAFTSFNFLVFFPLVVVVYYLTPLRYRYLLLLFASYFFYINIKPVYALLLTGVIGSTYLFTRLIDMTEDNRKKKACMTINILLVLLPLFFFKYFSQINSSLIVFTERIGFQWPLPEIKFILPLGISFYTFMAIGYTIDVYNEEIECERNPGIVALFISFFPLILSGPVERAKNVIPQFRNFHRIDYGNVTAGLKMMLWGYFMKLVVADRIGLYVDVVYSDIAGNNGSSLLVASLLYPFQVYTDLGGYSLIAIGTAKVMGLEVIQNFRRPFFATSMAEFWRRWHISLITWLTDYIYTPLSFVLRSYKIWGTVMVLMLTFLISGIWHGATMTFIVWGLMQGIFLSFDALFNERRNSFEKRYNLKKKAPYILLCMMFTFILFAASQVFGRSPDVKDALLALKKLLSPHGIPYLDLTNITYFGFGLMIVLIKDFSDEFFPGKIQLMENRKIVVRYISYLALLFIIILLGVYRGKGFIYFQF